MSFKADNVEHELTVKELLELLLEETRIIRMHYEILTNEKIKPEEIEE